MELPSISIDRLRAFIAVVEGGGFTAAGGRLNLSKHAVSQQIGKLEKSLGVSLFTRTTRAVVPTEEGRRLYANCELPLRGLQAVLDDVGRNRVSGELRITAPADVVGTVLSTGLVDFGRLHPDLRISLIADSRVLDLVEERIDLAVRLGWPRDSSLRAVKVGEFEMFVVATSRYLAAPGMPVHPRDLTRLDWIELSILPEPNVIAFTDRHGETATVRMRPRFSASTPESTLALVQAGGGIALATNFSAGDLLRRGDLVRLLPEWRLPRGGIYLTWPNLPQEPPRLRALIDFLRDWFATRDLEKR